MTDTLTPNMAVDVPRTVSGEQIVDDVCLQIADRLSRDCNLRGSDSYASYSARIRVDLWLQDVDTTEVNADVVIGQAEAAPPSRTIAMGVGAAADQVAGALPQSLERFADDDAGVAAEAAAPKPWRAPKNRPRRF
jgi:hypothetical protein